MITDMTCDMTQTHIHDYDTLLMIVYAIYAIFHSFLVKCEIIDVKKIEKLM